ncbi:MAG: flavin reductase family protein, partial [Planctomycetota bacterium]
EGRPDLMKPFFRDDGPDAFGGLVTGTGPGGGRYLAEALAWIECRVSGRIEAGAHVLVVAEVLAGDVLTSEDGPAVHLRKTGFSY